MYRGDFMDFFNEWIVKRKKTAQDYMSVVITVMVAIMILYGILLQFMMNNLIYFIPVEIAIVIYVAYKIIASMNVEFEYFVTNGDLDIDRIVSKKRRKKLVRIKLKDVEYFAPFEDEHIKVAEDVGIKKIIDASSSLDAPRLHFVIYYNNSEKTCLLFEPTDEMIENFSNYIPRALNHVL